MKTCAASWKPRLLRKHKQIESQIAELQSELELAQTRRDTLRNILQFVSGVNGSGGSLRAELEELEKSIPAENNTQGANANTSTTSSRRSEATGILGLITDLISISKKIHTIDSRIQQANALQQASSQIRAPFSARMKDLLKNSNDIVQQPDSTDSAVLAQQKQQLDTMTTQFKQVSGIVIPLSKQSILLDLYKRSLGELARFGEVRLQHHIAEPANPARCAGIHVGRDRGPGRDLAQSNLPLRT